MPQLPDNDYGNYNYIYTIESIGLPIISGSPNPNLCFLVPPTHQPTGPSIGPPSQALYILQNPNSTLLHSWPPSPTAAAQQLALSEPARRPPELGVLEPVRAVVKLPRLDDVAVLVPVRAGTREHDERDECRERDGEDERGLVPAALIRGSDGSDARSSAGEAPPPRRKLLPLQDAAPGSGIIFSIDDARTWCPTRPTCRTRLAGWWRRSRACSRRTERPAVTRSWSWAGRPPTRPTSPSFPSSRSSTRTGNELHLLPITAVRDAGPAAGLVPPPAPSTTVAALSMPATTRYYYSSSLFCV